MSWIPVEERLPGLGPWYIPVTLWGGKTGVARYEPTTEEWYDVNGGVRHVIAWQPLPEPYKKPRRFVVYGPTIPDSFEVWRTDVELVKGMPYGSAAVAMNIPTREAAETIAKVYEEAYRGE